MIYRSTIGRRLVRSYRNAERLLWIESLSVEGEAMCSPVEASANFRHTPVARAEAIKQRSPVIVRGPLDVDKEGAREAPGCATC